MSDRERVLTAVLAGAVVGGVVGYLYMTESGRRLRSQIDPRLDEALREIGWLRTTVGKVQSVAAEGWRSLNEVASESRWATPRQSSPF